MRDVWTSRGDRYVQTNFGQCDLQDLGLTGAAIMDIARQKDGCLRLACKMAGGQAQYLAFNP